MVILNSILVFMLDLSHRFYMSHFPLKNEEDLEFENPLPIPLIHDIDLVFSVCVCLCCLLGMLVSDFLFARPSFPLAMGSQSIVGPCEESMYYAH